MLLLRTSRGVDPGIPLLRSLGSNAHVWLPGASGVSVASLPSNNYLLSDFATYSGVDDVVGGVKDGMNQSGGISLTQATTANKPLVRRGALNLLTYSNDFTNAAWVKTNITPAAGVSDPDGGTTATTITATAGSATMLQSTGGTAPSGSPSSIYVKRRTGSGALSMWNGSAYVAVTVTSSWTRVTQAHNGVGTFYSGFRVATSGDAFDIWHAQSEIGQTDSDYTPTTTVAASNPSAGKYWWSFDGSNDSLLSDNLGITNACTIVIAGRVNAMPSVIYVVAGEDANGVQVTIYADGSFSLDKNTVSTIVRSAAGLIVAGVPFVITARLSGGTAVVRLDGVQKATAATALTYSATTGMRIGSKFDSSFPLNGALGWVVPLPTALSDADCLAVERLVGSQFPGMAAF